jgi:virulence factor BrkB
MQQEFPRGWPTACLRCRPRARNVQRQEGRRGRGDQPYRCRRPTELSPVTPEAGPDKPARLGGRGLFAALRRTGKQFSADSLTDRTAALTYYGVLSDFPGLVVIVSVLGLIGRNGQQTVQDAAHQLAPNGQLRQLVDTVLDQVKQPGAAGLAAIVGIVLAFWSASGYVAAFMRASNAVYDVAEGRPIWKTLPIRVGVTAVVGVMLVLSAAIIVVTGSLAKVIGDKVGLNSTPNSSVAGRSRPARTRPRSRTCSSATTARSRMSGRPAVRAPEQFGHRVGVRPEPGLHLVGQPDLTLGENRRRRGEVVAEGELLDPVLRDHLNDQLADLDDAGKTGCGHAGSPALIHTRSAPRRAALSSGVELE